MQTILLNDLNDFVLNAVLDGEEYQLYFGWNETGEYWNLGIGKNNAMLIKQLKIVPNYPLLRQYRRATLPKGEFVAITMNKKASTIGRKDFVDSKAFFVYVNEDELNAV